MVHAKAAIAIVDDDPSVLKALSRLLRAHAFDVTSYSSAEEFLKSMPDWRHECLILDLQMPHMNGLELLQHLKQLGLRIPTIVITANGDAGMRERCEMAGATDFLLKPLQDSSLVAAIAAARIS